jgi:hypothetical protein
MNILPVTFLPLWFMTMSAENSSAQAPEANTKLNINKTARQNLFLIRSPPRLKQMSQVSSYLNTLYFKGETAPPQQKPASRPLAGRLFGKTGGKIP